MSPCHAEVLGQGPIHVTVSMGPKGSSLTEEAGSEPQSAYIAIILM